MSKNLKKSLIFGGGKKLLEVDQIEQELDELDNERDSEGLPQGGSRRWCSAYVAVFESMVNTVRQHEHALLSTKEIKILEQFAGLCYNSRYCLTRLVLRKVNQWHPISSLERYKKEVGEEGLTVAVRDLCLPLEELFGQNAVELEHSDSTELENLVEPVISVKTEDGPEIIDLSTELDDEEDVNPDITSPSFPSRTVHSLWSNQTPRKAIQPQAAAAAEDSIQVVLHSDRSGINIGSFCENESVMTTREILGRINKDQLTGLAKEMKCKIGPKFKKEDIVNCLLRHAVNQRVLDFSPRPLSENSKGKCRDDGERQSLLSDMFVKQEFFTKPQTTQEVRLRQLAIKRLGPCIRLNSEFFCLVRRLHIICFRETEHPTSLLLPALLSTFKKRNYTPYTPNRTDQVWASREDLLEYERALELDKLLDDIMEVEEPEAVPKRAATGTPAYRRDGFTTPITPSAKGTRKTPVRTPGSILSCRLTTTPGSDLDGGVEGSVHQELAQLDKKDKMKLHFVDWIYPTWQNYVMDETRRGVRPRPIGLERFDPGHVYTRMVHKATRVFGPLQEYELELETLDALLDQRFWARGKRAKWYTRRALVLKHLAGMERDKAKKRDLHALSLEGIKTALLDDDTGIVHRPGLVKRLLILENTLKIPSHQRSSCAGELRNAPIVELKAVRVHVDPQKNEKENAAKLDGYIIAVAGRGNRLETDEEKLLKKTGKSSWKGRDDQVVNVESRALEHYEDQGYKGFHCETRILTTIFGLLFWDIIFADIPGSFETQYQTAPLDLLYDSFYRARKKIIDRRLQELRDGKGPDILRQHDEAYRDKTVVCVGVSWDLCPREDLLEIVDCIGGETLAFICQLFCEDYEGRRSGAPDLFVWHVGERKCKFVEVKGPNDRPQENQKYWFDALLRANADVELCKVVDVNNSNKRKPKTPISTRRKKSVVVADDFDSEEQDYDALDVEGMGPSRKRRRVSSNTPCPSRTSRTMNPIELTPMQTTTT